jgi:outer membrane receptor protein involved in Fe transport
MHVTINRLLLGTSLLVVATCSAQAQAQTQTPAPAPAPAPPEADAPTTIAPDAGEVGDIIVTAQKRSESINKVGMSITAQTGEQLLQQGITSTADLAKVVPGFTFEGAVGTQPVYSIRGIGFHDVSLASGQTVAIYADEVPMPFAQETIGADYDIERVEVLKGPQGTLFGQNSTGGAVNYVAAKPTSDLQAGFDATYGRFSTSDLSGFLSGPITSTLRGRIAFRSVQGDGWQKRYGVIPFGNGTGSTTLGKQNRISGRLLLDWTPTDQLSIALNVNLRRDRSEAQAPQLVRLNPSSPSNPLTPEILAFPAAPLNNRAASWDPGVDYSQNNHWKEASLRIAYEAAGATITSISAYQKFHRDSPAQDADGTPYKVLQYGYLGDVETFYQELRAGGTLFGAGNWIVGGNYERDDTFESAAVTNPLATSRILFGLPNPGSITSSTNRISTYGIYGNADYPIMPNLSFQAGVRYTKSDRVNSGCSADRGDGSFSAIFLRIQTALAASGAKTTPIVPIPPGGCVTLNAGFTPTLFTGTLKEDNVSWRAGLNWTATPGTLVYANVSKGYKSGSFPLAAAASTAQYVPVPQEELLAYEGGIKSRVVRTLQLNASAFYYDYTNKQIGGTYIDSVFGRLAKLVTIPVSRVYGFEVSADWRPLPGLTLTPSATYMNSKILGAFSNFTPQGVVQSFVGDPFPYAPRWQANGSADYTWSVSNDWSAFLGGNVAYQGGTNAQLGRAPVYDLKAYTLVDLRAGIESKSGAYRLSVWGSNVFDTFYVTRAGRSFDFDTRSTGMPARYGVSLSYRYK